MEGGKGLTMELAGMDSVYWCGDVAAHGWPQESTWASGGLR